MQQRKIRVVESWIEQELFSEGEPSGIYRVNRSLIQGATPINPSTLPPQRRPSTPSEISELFGALEGELEEQK